MEASSELIESAVTENAEPIEVYSLQELKVAMKKVATGKVGSKDLTREEAGRTLHTIFEGKANDTQIGSFLTAMRIKSTNSEELMGFTDAIKQHSILINPKVNHLLNASGPYNGRSRTPYMSLAGSFAACAEGAQVIIHSTDHLPPKWGVSISETFDELGIPWDLSPSAVEECIEKTGFGYLHEKNFSLGIEGLRNYRVSLNFRTLLHTCELIANPAQANRMLIGIFHKPYYEMFIGTCQMENVEHALILQGVEGSDEMPLKKCNGVEIIKGEVIERQFEPKKMGFESSGDIACSDPKTGASMILDALEKKNTHAYEAAILNGGLRIYLTGGTARMEEGIDRARNAIDSGSAREKLDEFKKVSSSL